MRSLKEISRNITPLFEGVFDIEGDNRIEKEIKKDSVQAFLNGCKGDYSIVTFKDGSVRVNGKLIITNLKTDKIYFNCRDFHGRLIIENCPKLETLKGSFLENISVFDGSITINQCPSLTSLEGLPGLIKGDLSITNCKKIKSYEGIDMVYGNLYWGGNGKKYSSEQLKSYTHVIKKVFCEGYEENLNTTENTYITEAFNNQWLQKLARQLKKYSYKEYSWEPDSKLLKNKVGDIFRYGRTSYGYGSRILDKITNDDIDVYDMGDAKEKKELEKVFYKSYSKNDPNGIDVLLIYDEQEEEFIIGFGAAAKYRGEQTAGIDYIHIPYKHSNHSKITTSHHSKSEAIDKLRKYGVGYTAVVINSGENTGTSSDAARKIHREREETRKDMINPGDIDQYKEIAASNIKRYKNLIAQAKLTKKRESENSEYNNLIDEYEKINTRVIALVRKIAKTPESYERYEITDFLNWLRDEQRYNYNWKPGRTSQFYGENGLAYCFKEFMGAYLNAFGTTPSYVSTSNEGNLKSLESASKKLKDALDIADAKLKKFGV